MAAQDQVIPYAEAALKGPIPGESLTNDPDSPYPFEKAPEFTTLKAANEYIFEKIIDEEVYIKLMEQLAQEVSIMEITQVLLFEGFNQGKWNPDLMLLLIEPTAYMLMSLAERADINYKITKNQEQEDINDEEKYGTGIADQVVKRLNKAQKSEEIPISPEIEEKIEAQAPQSSILEKPQPSLLGR
jgi:hypothetical protein